MKQRSTDIANFIKDLDLSTITNVEIAKALNIHPQTVSNYFTKNNITKPTVHMDTLHKKQLVQKLIDDGLTQQQIAKYLSMSVRQITLFCNYHQINNPNKSITVNITFEEEQLIIGSLLGDGHIDKYGRLRLMHSLKQKTYLLQKADLFKNFKYVIRYRTRFDKRTNKTYESIILDTKIYQNFKNYHKRWYNPNKIICFEDFEKIEALGLAIWFMDDGYKNNNSVALSTNCFTKAELLKVCIILKSKFDLDFKVRSQILVLSIKEKQKFYDLIKPFMCKELLYKFA